MPATVAWFEMSRVSVIKLRPVGLVEKAAEAVDEEEAARMQLLKFFEALGFSDPLAVDGRKRLSTVLFS